MALNINLPGVSQAIAQQQRPITYRSLDPKAMNLVPQIQRAAADAASKGYDLENLQQYFQDEADRKALETAERLATGSEALEEAIAKGIITDKSKEDIMSEHVEDVNEARIAEAEAEAQQALVYGENAQLMQSELASQEEKKSNLWLGLTVAGLVAIGGVTWYYMSGQNKSRRR